MMETTLESKLNVTDSGAGDPVLLLHSSGLSGRQWRRLAHELVEQGRRVVIPDLSGHGASDPWPEPTAFSFRTDVERVVEILRQLEPAHVVGHSYGGFVALHAALIVPRSIRSLTLFDPVVFAALDATADNDARAVLFGLDLSWGPDVDRERWLRTFVDFWTDGGWTSLREDMRAEFRRVAWVVREGVRTMMMEDTTPFSTYGAFEFPVHLITGEKSPLPARRVVQRLRETIRGALLSTVPGVGHLAPVTHADRVNPVFIEGLGVTRQRSLS